MAFQPVVRDLEASSLDNQTEFDEFFTVSETMNWIASKQRKRIALQLPDSLLKYSFRLTQRLNSRRGEGAAEFETFVLADTSYGECCVDQIAASHNGADAVIHYGRSCLSRPTYLPTFLVLCDLGHRITQETLSQSFGKFLTENDKVKAVYVELDCRYESCRSKILQYIQLAKPSCSFTLSSEPPSELVPLSQSPAVGENTHSIDFRLYDAVVFIGPKRAPQLDRLAFACAPLENCKVYSCDPDGMDIRVTEAHRALSRRFVAVEKVKDASIIGILVGTMSVALFGNVIDKVKKVIDQSGRKSYTFVFGKLSPSKLANFPDVDAFVLIACAFNTLIDSKEFNKPIVTPYELEVALNGRDWGKYAWDFSQILEDQQQQERIDGAGKQAKGDEEDEQIHFSLTSNRITTKQRKPLSQTLTLRYESPAAESLAAKTFKGLDPEAKHLTPTKASAGQVGVASKLYQLDDHAKTEPR